LYLDLENLLYQYRESGDWQGAVLCVTSLVHGLAARGTLVARVACGDRTLVAELAFELDRLGVRSHVHEGGVDGADKALLRMLSGAVPGSCGTVVIASGDHIFAAVARHLRQQGKRVEVFAARGTISFQELLTIEQDLSELERGLERAREDALR
jgi:hypothetical protein